jgi:hypothetical protein
MEEELINTTIQKLSNEVISIENPERWDFISAILKTEWMWIVISFIVVPSVLFFMLAHLFNFKGKTSKTMIILTHLFVFIVCEVIGFALFLMLNVL